MNYLCPQIGKCLASHKNVDSVVSSNLRRSIPGIIFPAPEKNFSPFCHISCEKTQSFQTYTTPHAYPFPPCQMLAILSWKKVVYYNQARVAGSSWGNSTALTGLGYRRRYRWHNRGKNCGLLLGGRRRGPTGSARVRGSMLTFMMLDEELRTWKHL